MVGARIGRALQGPPKLAVDRSVFAIDDGVAGGGAPLVAGYRYVSPTEYGRLAEQARRNAAADAGSSSAGAAGPGGTVTAAPSEWRLDGGWADGTRSSYGVAGWENAVRLTGGSLGYYQGMNDGTAPYVRLVAAEARASAVFQADLTYLGKAYAIEAGSQLAGLGLGKFVVAPLIGTAAPYLSRAAGAVTARLNAVGGRVTTRLGIGTRSIAAKGAPAFADIATPYGPALQSLAPEAIAARSAVEGGAPLYRLGTIGRSEAAEAQFWALEHPLNPGYAARYGIPPENVAKFDFIETATLKPGTPFVTRPAPGIGSNPGGGIEVVTPQSGVTMKYFGRALR